MCWNSPQARQRRSGETVAPKKKSWRLKKKRQDHVSVGPVGPVGPVYCSFGNQMSSSTLNDSEPITLPPIVSVTL